MADGANPADVKTRYR